MKNIEKGYPAPDFCLPADDGRDISLSDFKTGKLLIYFYPKDDTPGCTQEACDFRNSLKSFESLGIQILGISKDSIERHKKFKAKHSLNFPLLSDEHGDVCERYGVWVEKSMYGKKYMGIERTTILIDENGDIEQIWRKVKVNDHVDEVMNYLQYP